MAITISPDTISNAVNNLISPYSPGVASALAASQADTTPGGNGQSNVPAPQNTQPISLPKTASTGLPMSTILIIGVVLVVGGYWFFGRK